MSIGEVLINLDTGVIKSLDTLSLQAQDSKDTTAVHCHISPRNQKTILKFKFCTKYSELKTTPFEVEGPEDVIRASKCIAEAWNQLCKFKLDLRKLAKQDASLSSDILKFYEKNQPKEIICSVLSLVRIKKLIILKLNIAG